MVEPQIRNVIKKCEAVCWSCLDGDHLRNMHQAYQYDGNEEIYADMLSYCFSIKIEKYDPDSSFFICAICVVRLRESVQFKMGIENTRRSIQIAKVEVEIKSSDDDGLAQDVEFLNMLDNAEDPAVGNSQEENLTARAISALPSLPKRKLKRKGGKKRAQKGVGKQRGKPNTIEKKVQKNSETAIKTENLNEEEMKEFMEQKRAKRRIYYKNLLPFELDGTELQCKICNEKFFFHKGLKTHMNVHFPNFQCETCNKWFATKQKLQRHVFFHAEPKECPVCTQFVKVFALRTHLRTYHPEYCINKCERCNINFRSFAACHKHMDTEHGTEENESKDVGKEKINVSSAESVRKD